MTTKQLDVKNKSYYFYNDFINLSNFSMNNLKLDKKTWKDIDIYYISYCNGIRTHNHLVRKRTLNHLAKLAK